MIEYLYMRPVFSLFQSHLDLAHQYWSSLVQKGDIVIDATCGHGRDTEKLCQLTLAEDQGAVYAFDIQQTAINSSASYLYSKLPAKLFSRLHFEQRCHSSFPASLSPGSVKLIVYNLGYLPKGNKTYTTQVDTTLQSLCQAQELLLPGGALSITCYPGHAEGERELEALLAYCSSLSSQEWSCCHHTWLNRHQSPQLLFIQKAFISSNPTTVR